MGGGEELRPTGSGLRCCPPTRSWLMIGRNSGSSSQPPCSSRVAHDGGEGGAGSSRSSNSIDLTNFSDGCRQATDGNLQGLTGLDSPEPAARPTRRAAVAQASCSVACS